MSLRSTFEALKHKHPGLGRLRLYSRNVDLAVANGADLCGFKVIINPALPPDRLELRNNQGELLASVMLPGKA